MVTAADIDAAAKRIDEVVHPTPVQHADRLSALTGANVYLKREDLQSVRSYKLRGAFNLLMQLSDEEKAYCKVMQICVSRAKSDRLVLDL